MKSNKAAIITDTHLGVRNDSPPFNENFKKSFKWFLDTLQELGVTVIIHLGDIFDRRKYINYVTANVARIFIFEEIQKRNMTMHIISGNHDHYYKNTHEYNSLDEMISGKYSNIITYNNPQVIVIDGVRIQLLPWITESNKEESIKVINQPTCDILMGHLEVNGFEIHKGTVYEHGYDQSLFSKYKLVLSGHFHHRSKINNIFYVGAFSEFTWSDYNDPRGFHIMDLNTLQMDFYQNPFNMFMMVRYDDVNLDMSDEIQSINFNSFSEKYVKIIVSGKKDLYMFDTFIEELMKASPLNVLILEESLSLNNETDSLDQTEDTPTILKKYVDGLELPVSNNKVVEYLISTHKAAVDLQFVLE